MADSPTAAEGLRSYRYPTTHGRYMMIGAIDDADAMKIVRRNNPLISPNIHRLERWNGKEYVPTLDHKSMKFKYRNVTIMAEDVKSALIAHAEVIGDTNPDELKVWNGKDYVPALTPRFKDFAAYMQARHSIHHKREKGLPKPWTEDEVLLNYRFCNIFRELDTVTIWVDDHIRKPFANNKNLWLMLAIARTINWPDTLQFLIDYPDKRAFPIDDTFSPVIMGKAMDEYQAAGNKVYTGAYMIRAESDKSREWYYWSKNRYIAEIVIGSLWNERESWVALLENEPTLEAVWTYFQSDKFRGFGPFMSYEVVTDYRHTRYCRNADDIYTWANAGPGAIRGLNRLYGRPLTQQPPRKQTNAEMHKLMNDLNDNPPSAFSECSAPIFEMRDIEHTLCEFDKYERVRLGEGRPRSKYAGKQ